MIDQEEILLVSKAMRVFGGSFMRALGEALQYADQTNAARIKQTWPDDWERYKGMAEHLGESKLDLDERAQLAVLRGEAPDDLVELYTRIEFVRKIDWHGLAIAMRARGLLEEG